MTSPSSLRILVLGYIVRRPLGGGTWPFIQYPIGLQRLGHDVYFLEDSDDYPCCYDPSRHVTDTDPTFGLAFADRVFSRTSLKERWAYYDAHTEAWSGPCHERIPELCRTADLVINVSAINPLRPWLMDIPRRAYVDTDPAFEQVRQLTDPERRERALRHNVFFTYGENIPGGLTPLPGDGLPWQPCRPPVVLDLWPVTPGPERGAFTTVMLWDSYAPRDHGDLHLGMKSESFGPYLDLPGRTRETLELAVGGPAVPRSMLRDHGWSVVDPLGPTRDLGSYQRYLRNSRGEFTVAKHGYAVSHCGWFSERSAHYLASGRPVITQETGFSEWLATGSGLFSFASPEEALGALEAVQGDYQGHCAGARALAAEAFDSSRVLGSLVERAMAPLPKPRLS